MNEVVVLTPERILEVTEDVLRRFGLAKATVVDVARALDVSHGSVYRHFPSKVSLREAVAKRWLDRANAPLAEDRGSLGPGAGPARPLAAHDVCDQAQEGLRRPRDVRDLSGAGAGGLRGGEGAQGTPGRPDRAYPVRWREAGRICRLPTSRPRRAPFSTRPAASIIPRMPRNGAIRRCLRGSTRLLALLLRGLEAPRKR